MKSKKGAVQDKSVLSVGQWLLFLARKMAYYYYHYIVLHVTRTHFCTFWSSVGWQLISWRNQRHGWIGIGETHHQNYEVYVWGVGLVLHIYGCGCSINCWVARYDCWRYFLSRLRYWKLKVRSTCYTCRLSFMAANKVRGKKVHVVSYYWFCIVFLKHVWETALTAIPRAILM